jgi:uncharacterized membrane protein (UPF0182 family)
VTGRRWVLLAVAAAVLLLGGRLGAGAYAEYEWFRGIGALDAWRVHWAHAALLRALAFGLGTTLALANLWAVRRSVVSVVLPRRVGNLEIGEEVPGALLSSLTVVVAVCLGLVFSIPATGWQAFAMARSGIPFGESDPYFHADLGVWIFWFPFERALHAWLVFVAATITLLVVVSYFLTPSLRVQRGTLHVAGWVRRHLALLAAVALVLVAWAFRLQAFDLLLHGSAPGGVFGAADQQFGIPVTTILAYTCFAAGAVILWAGWSGQPRLAVAVLSIVLLLVPTLQWIVPSVVQATRPVVDAAERERPYDAVRAGFTRRAFSLDRIRPFPDSLAATSLEALRDMPVWDPSALSRALSRRQRHGGLVGAPGLTAVEGIPMFVSVAAPFIAPEELSSGISGWTVLRVRADGASEQGGVARVDAAGRQADRDERLRDVLVADGARGIRMVDDSARMVLGARMAHGPTRLAEAWSQQDLRLLRDDGADRVLVRRRDVRERVSALVPFLRQGGAVTPIILADSLLWSVELFTASSAFPLSKPLTTPHGPVRYLAHAGTALVHAHSGLVTIVPVPDADPILRAWSRLLPRTLGAVRSLPAEVAAQLPPLVAWAEWQAEAYAAVGVRGATAVRRHIPPLDGSDTVTAGRYPSMLWWSAVPSGAWSIPLVDPDDRIAGLVVATGGEGRGVFWHSVEPTPTGWTASIDTLRGGGPSPRAAGRIRAVPLRRGGFALVQPFYDWPRDEAPTVGSVSVLAEGLIRRGVSLPAALGVAARPTPDLVVTSDDIPVRAQALYARMRAALQRGDWAAFGEAMDALGTLLDRPRR